MIKDKLSHYSSPLFHYPDHMWEEQEEELCGNVLPGLFIFRSVLRMTRSVAEAKFGF